MSGPAEAIAAAFTAGDVSAVELADTHLAAAEQREAELNAYTRLDREGVLARAAYLDERRARGHVLGPLAGVPVAVKDIIDQAGVPTTAGSSFLTAVPERSAPVVARLEAAGAVIIGRTGLHEFAFGFSSENAWWGPVRNPWDTTLSPGGSSGGSAAAVAAGSAPIALGTDTGGSVRVPAALCGLFGLKVTHGRVPTSGVFPLAESLDTVGPLARSSADLALAYVVIAGEDPDDPWSAPRTVTPPEPPPPLDGLRMAVPRPWLDQPMTDPVRTSFAAALDALADNGATVAEVQAPTIEPVGMIAQTLAEVATVHRRWLAERPDAYGADVRDRLAQTAAVSVDQYAASLRWRASLRRAFGRVLAGADLIATPAVAANRKTIGEDTIDVAGVARPYRPLLSGFSALVNQAGLPAVVVPLATDGVPPPSLQLIGPPWSEARLLAVAAALEQLGIAGFRPPPGRDLP